MYRKGGFSGSIEKANQELLKKWSDISYTVRQAVNNSPFYADQWKDNGLNIGMIKKPSDFHSIPFTSKQDLRESYPDKMLAVPWKEVAIVHESSGTTGEPTPSFFTKEDLDAWHSNMLLNGVGLNESDVVLIKTPYSMLSTAHQMHGAARIKNAMVIPAGNRSSLMPYSRIVRLIRDYKPTIIYCMPIELIIFSRMASRMGMDTTKDFPWIRGCVINGEMLSPGKQTYLEKLWNTKIYQDYGSTETGTLGGVCQLGQLHVWNDWYYFEVEDQYTGKCGDEGTGELIITSLRRKGMPLIRYRTEDLVTLKRNNCSCDLGLPELQLWGRKSDRIKWKGNFLFPIEIENLVYSNLVGLGPVFWTASLNKSSMEMLLEHTARDHQRIKAKKTHIQKAIKEELNIEVNISLVPEGTIMRMDVEQSESMVYKPKYIYSEGERMQKLNYQVVGLR
ncbi:MAG: phenylacetate--CoA ligase family protein [Ignavibacteriales bacterium]